MTRRRKLAWIGGGLLGLLLLVGLGGVLVLRSEWFQAKVRDRIVRELETATGGTVQIGRFDFSWSGMTATVAPLVIRGTEPATAPPLLRAESVQLTLKIVSAFKRDIDLQSLVVDRPAVNLIVYPDGRTNIPEPKVPRPPSGKDPIEEILALEVREFAIRDGVFRVDERSTPLNVEGNGLQAKLLYDFTGPRYRGDITLRQLVVDTPQIDPVSLDVALALVLEKGRIELTKGRLATTGSSILLSGVLTDLRNPKANASVNASLSLAELGKPLQLAPPHRGDVSVEGTVRYSDAEGFVFQTKLDGRNLDVRRGDIALRGRVSAEAQASYQAPTGLAGQVTLAGTGVDFRQGALRVQGNASLRGEASFRDANAYAFTGRLTGNSLNLTQGTTQVRNARLATNVHLTPGDLSLRDVSLAALGGSFQGGVQLARLSDYSVQGTLQGFSLQELAAFQGVKGVTYSGTVSGPVKLTGSLDRPNSLQAEARLRLAPGSGPVPVQGNLEVGFDQRTGAIRLGPSTLTLPNSRLAVSGTPGQTLQVRLESRNLDDFLPALALASDQPPGPLPLRLRNGSVTFDGTVTGPTSRPEIAGRLAATSFEAQGRLFDRLVADVTASQSGATARNVSLTAGTLRLDGQAQVALTKWKPTDASALSASVTLRGANLQELLAQSGTATAAPLPVSGVLGATAQVSGTVGNPQATARIELDRAVAFDEPLENVAANLRYTKGLLELTSATAQRGTARLEAKATYRHAPDDLKNGQIRFEAASNQTTLNQFASLQKLKREVRGDVSFRASGEATVRNGEPALTVLNGEAVADNLRVEGRAVGNLRLTAQTAGDRLSIATTGDLRGSPIKGAADIRLTPGYPGQGQVEIGALEFTALEDLAAAFGTTADLPVNGTVAGRATFNGPLTDRDRLRARIELTKLEVRPDAGGVRTAQADQALTLRNEGPLVFELDGQTVTLSNVRLVGNDTRLEASGTLSLASQTPWNLRLNGDVNLALLQTFDPDILASGRTILDASIRGSLSQPQVNGRLELREANLNIADAPIGLENANGTVLFDRTRATIQRLTAQAGGGNLSVTGFVGFGSGTPDLRMAAIADDVRVRTEGVSVTADANLSLTGTLDRSLLTGEITVRRAGLTPRTDVGGLLAPAADPVETPNEGNALLRNMRLDVAVSSAPNLQFTTSLTSDVQADIELRVKGTPVKPAVLGRVLVNQGEANFLGNKYTINRGQISFFNPVKIEPVVDLDLQTEARGTTITINFNGPLNKLNTSYRADPPLQSSEIIALLALGRTPGSNPAVASSQTVTNTSFLQTGANTLVGQAIAAPLSNRLQRFFGVNRLKIDPLLTGVDNNPQARLTLEQQVSRDITITIITNLTNSQQQVVRLQWDLSRTWSVVAVRDENGIFGVDFQFRKRFR